LHFLAQRAFLDALDKVGDALMSALSRTDSSNMTTSCTATAEWQNALAQSNYAECNGASFTQATCDAYKLAFAGAVATCEDSGKALAYDLLIGACIIGGVVGIALCIWGACKVKSCAEHYTCSCAEKKEKEEAAPPAP
jgi:Mn2+/Fe2+ NRAMP family transporter